jgi:hypothetical protein
MLETIRPSESMSQATGPTRRSRLKWWPPLAGLGLVVIIGLAGVRCGGNDATGSSSCQRCTCRCSVSTATVELYQGKPLECPSGCSAFCAGERLGSFVSGSCAD